MSTAETNKAATEYLVTEYDSIWYHADFWPGEYPSRFSVIKDRVVLMGREEMKLTSPKDVHCPVPKLATFSPWNNTRNAASKLQYKAVSKPSTVTITADVSMLVETAHDRVEVTLPLQQGDTLQFMVYYSEGMGLYRYNDTNFVMSQSDEMQFEENLKEDDLWLKLPAESGGHGWVLFSDAIATDGIVETGNDSYGEAKDLPDPASLTLDGVMFVSGQATLTDASKQILDELSNQLWQVYGVKFEVGGYTDSWGSAPSNQALSQSRAEAVVDYLNQVGDWFSEDKEPLKAVGYGESKPIADNDTAEGRAANRRVELKIT